MKDNPVLIILSGPAGSGKNTVAEALMEEFPKLKRVVTSTSRAPRGSEKDGIDYHFMSPEDFKKAIQRGEFYEYAQVHDKFYGTSKKAISEAFAGGNDLILIIDVQGAAAWRKIAKTESGLTDRILTVFVAPSNIDELRKRLANRATETQDQIDRRLRTAEEEYKQKYLFDEKIESTTRIADLAALRHIYLKRKGIE